MHRERLEAGLLSPVSGESALQAKLTAGIGRDFRLVTSPTHARRLDFSRQTPRGPRLLALGRGTALLNLVDVLAVSACGERPSRSSTDRIIAPSISTSQAGMWR